MAASDWARSTLRRPLALELAEPEQAVLHRPVLLRASRVGRLRGELGTLQVYEETTGLRVGGFDPPVFASAGRTLFGGWSSHVFTDLFHGTDAEGKRFAVYEGTLTRRQGKHTVTVFTGQVYAFQRRSGGGGETAILPDKGLFNFIKPKGMDRVRFDSDPDFDRRFEIYSTHPASALGLAGSDVRRALLELRQQGKVYAQRFARGDSGWQPANDLTIAKFEDWLTQLPADGRGPTPRRPAHSTWRRRSVATNAGPLLS